MGHEGRHLLLFKKYIYINNKVNHSNSHTIYIMNVEMIKTKNQSFFTKKLILTIIKSLQVYDHSR